jgi:predicted permease
MRGITRDLAFAWRRLRATPLFTTFAIVTLALGIGVTTGIYSAVRAVMTPPSGLNEVDRLVRVTRSARGSRATMSLSWPEYQDFLSQQSGFDSVAAWNWFRASVSTGGQSAQVSAEMISGAYFETLGVSATHGRTLQRSDDEQTAPPVAVISHRAWERWFNSSPDAIGQPVKINGTSLTIAGVIDPQFTGLFNGGVVSTAVWTTFAAARSLANADGVSFDPANRGRRWISLTARLAPGRSFDEASTEVAAIGARVNEAYPDRTDRFAGGAPQPARPWVARRLTDVPKILGADRLIGPLSTALMTAVLLVLLVACTNLANLMLARTSGRSQELAVRLSLGASRPRVLWETLSETVLLTGIGGFLAVGIARLLMVVLGNELMISRGLAVQLAPRLDPAVLGAATLATFLAMLIAGLAPAFFAARSDIRRALAADSLGAASPRWRGRRYLIAVQVAISVVLVTIAGLCVAQVREHQRKDTGVDFDRLALVDVDFRQPQYDQGSVREIVSSLLQKVGRQPGVLSVSMSSGLPIGIGTPGAQVNGPQSVAMAELVAATPQILQTLGVNIRRGRGLDVRDVAGSPLVVVLGERTAEKLFGTSDVLGRTVTVHRRSWVGEPEWPKRQFTVVGIAESSGRELAAEPQRGEVIFVPLAQQFEDRLVLAVRSDGDPGALVNTLRQIVQSTAPDAPITQSLTGAALQAEDTLFFQVVAGIATVLGAMALAVALAGLYGILSFLVAGRTREIGIRIAIGANDRLIRRQILREGLSPVLLGLVIGLGLGALARLGMQPFFERMMPATDLAVLVLVPLLFIAAGLGACYLPARRASRVNPIVALRQL